jgi:hypothetical protein
VKGKKLIGCANIKDAPQLAFNGDTFKANTLRGCPISESGAHWAYRCKPENYWSNDARELAVLFNEARKIGFASYIVISQGHVMVWMDIFGMWHEVGFTRGKVSERHWEIVKSIPTSLSERGTLKMYFNRFLSDEKSRKETYLLPTQEIQICASSAISLYVMELKEDGLLK